MNDNSQARQHSPVTERNREPILAALRRVLPGAGLALEVASGSGQHAAWFAPRFPGLAWQPSAPLAASRQSITAWSKWLAGTAEDAGNLLTPLHLDVHQRPWPVAAADAVICINMVHITPWATTVALLAGVAEILPAGRPLYLYGPYRINGRHTSDGNRAFDLDLKHRDSQWGVRDLGRVAAEAARHGLVLDHTLAMPSNNLSVIFRKG